MSRFDWYCAAVGGLWLLVLAFLGGVHCQKEWENVAIYMEDLSE